MCLDWDLFDSWLDWGCRFRWGRSQSAWPLSSQPIRGSGRHCDFSLLVWAWITWLRGLCLLRTPQSAFSTVRLLPHPLSPCTVWKEVSMCTPYLGVKGYAPTPWGQRTCIRYLGFFCMGDVSLLFCLCIHPVIYLYQCGRMDFFLYFQLQCNTTSFCCSNCPIFDHWELFQLAPVSFWHTLITVKVIYLFFFVLPFSH